MAQASGPDEPLDLRGHALWVVAPFGVTRLLIYYVGWLSTWVLRHGKWWAVPHRPLDLFLRWDVGWYLGIVHDGYRYTPGKESSVAFYPLYPLAIRALSLFGLSPAVSGIVISNAALFVASVLTCALFSRQYRSLAIGRAAAVFLLVWPVSFFHSTVYSDSLFLALFAGATLSARRGRFLLAGVLGMCMSATKAIGAVALVPLALDASGIWLAPEDRPPRKGAPWLALTPLGAVFYALYQWHAFGDPLASFHIQAVWGRDMAGVMAAFTRASQAEPFYRWVFLGAAFYLALMTALMAASRVRPSDVVWCAIVFYATASSGSFEGLPRLTLMALPVFGFLAAWTETRPMVRQMALVTSSALLALMTALFANGYWMT